MKPAEICDSNHVEFWQTGKLFRRPSAPPDILESLHGNFFQYKPGTMGGNRVNLFLPPSWFFPNAYRCLVACTNALKRSSHSVYESICPDLTVWIQMRDYKIARARSGSCTMYISTCLIPLMWLYDGMIIYKKRSFHNHFKIN